MWKWFRTVFGRPNVADVKDAIDCGDLARVKKLLAACRRHGDFDDFNLRLWLSCASSQNDVEMVTTILQAGANAADDILNAVNEHHARIVEVLLSAGADPNGYYDGMEDDLSLLNIAVKEGDLATVKVLLRAGALTTSKERWSHNTPLHCAAEEGRTEIVAALLAAGADPCEKNHSGNTPREVAAAKRHDPIVKLLKTAEVEPRAVVEEGVTDSPARCKRCGGVSCRKCGAVVVACTCGAKLAFDAGGPLCENCRKRFDPATDPLAAIDIIKARFGDALAKDKALQAIVAHSGTDAACELLNDEVQAVLDEAEASRNALILTDLRPLVEALKKLGDPRGDHYEEIARRRNFPGW